MRTPLQQRSSLLALAGAIPPIWFLGAVTLFGALRAGYSPDHAGSELGQQGSEYAVAFNIAAFGGGALLYGLFAIAVATYFGRGWLVWLTLGQAATMGSSGVFSCDPGCPQVMVTPVGWGHTAFGLTYFVIAVILPGFAAREFRRRPEWRSFTGMSVITCLALVVLFVLGPTMFGPAHIGLWQRLTLAILGAWSILVALRLHRVLRHQEDSGQSDAVLSTAVVH
jgi:hypothetical protein